MAQRGLGIIHEVNGISLDEKTDCTVFAPIILKLQLSFYNNKVQSAFLFYNRVTRQISQNYSDAEYLRLPRRPLLPRLRPKNQTYQNVTSYSQTFNKCHTAEEAT